MILRSLWEYLSFHLDARNRFILRHKSVGTNKDLLWFHAASAGEWESLRPLATLWLQRGHPIGVSFFSESAKKFAEGFLSSLSQSDLDRVCYCGSSPKEREWKTFLREFNPRLLISNRYEAWPSLWASLSELHIPLALINAEPRSSLLWVRRALALFRVELPRLIFFAIHDAARQRLVQQFPAAQVLLAGDPRLERMEERKKLKNVRAEELKSEILAWKGNRKLLIVGNAWEVDLRALSPVFLETSVCFLVVPHDLSPVNLSLLQSSIHDYSNVRMCAEYGVLAELYSLADVAYVGGGFGKGIHSVIEPAAYGASIVAGSHRADSFSETVWLSASGQLSLANQTRKVAPLVRNALGSVGSKNREKYLGLWKEKLGASEVILERIRSLL